MDNIVVKQPCGIAKLLTAAFGIPIEKAFTEVGLYLCPTCDKAGTNQKYYPYCGKLHAMPPKKGRPVVPLICEWCDILFFRLEADVLNAAKHGQQHIFCGMQCFGAWSGKVNGFGAHGKGNKGEHNRSKTHCFRGHEFNADNTAINGESRRCKECTRIRQREYTRRKNENPSS